MITITEAQATLFAMPTKIYSVNLVVVEEVKCSRVQCYEELVSIAFEFGCLGTSYTDEHKNQTDMNFEFYTGLNAFEFMERAIVARCDAAISYVETLKRY